MALQALVLHAHQTEFCRPETDLFREVTAKLLLQFRPS